jgi:hypothetical protein
MPIWAQQERLWRRRPFLFPLLFLFLLWYVCFCLSQPELTFGIKIEHSLKEWSNGRKANKVSFSDDIAKLRYVFLHLTLSVFDIFSSYGHHLGNWNTLVKKAPRWAKFWQNELAKQILYVLYFCNDSRLKNMFCSSQHNDFLDDANEGKDIASLDFAALDKLADDWEGEEIV